MVKIDYVLLKRSFENRKFCTLDVFDLIYPDTDLTKNAIRLLIISRSLSNLAKDNQIVELSPNEYKLKTI